MSESIDSIIARWAEANRLPVATRYREGEVRSVELASDDGKRRCQIWIDQPVGGSIGVHVWDFKKRRSDMEATASTLLTALNTAYATAREWLSVPVRKDL